MGLQRKPRPQVPVRIAPPPTMPLELAPTDLAPIAQRMSAHPLDVPLDPNEVRTALWQACGNVVRAAQILMTDPARVAYLINRVPTLQTEASIARQLVSDKAEAVILEALEDEEDNGRADSAARFVLERIGRSRGYGSTATGLTPGVNLNFGGQGSSGQLAVKWDTDSDA